MTTSNHFSLCLAVGLLALAPSAFSQDSELFSLTTIAGRLQPQPDGTCSPEGGTGGAIQAARKADGTCEAKFRQNFHKTPVCVFSTPAHKATVNLLNLSNSGFILETMHHETGKEVDGVLVSIICFGQ